MPEKVKREDLRIQKTRRALYAALVTMLNRQKFTKVTVHDICTESLVSKTAFYAHFRDKYDLLGRWLEGKRTEILSGLNGLPEREAIQFLYEALLDNMTAVINLIDDADPEQQTLLYRFLIPRVSPNHSNEIIILEDFIAGGLYHVLASQLILRRRGSKEDIKKTIGYVYNLMVSMIGWDANLPSIGA